MNDVLETVSEDIMFSKKEISRFELLAKDFISDLKKQGITASLGGSLAKGTLVKKDVVDLDIFLLFETQKDLERTDAILKKMKLPGELKVVHGSRDYFQIHCKDYVLELVPTLKTKSPAEAQNVTDVSLLHVDYVRDLIKEDPSLAREIILAKAFCRAQRCYGAESYIKGFSGYSLEVFVAYFGSFEKFLKKVDKKRVYDPASHFRREKDVLFELNSAKLKSPLIVVDPTYQFRNITAGLGYEAYERFLKVANDFLKRPSVDYFYDSGIDLTLFKDLAHKKRVTFLVIEIASDREKGDIFGTKCKKFFDFFCAELDRNEQEILKKDFVYDGTSTVSYGYLVLKERENILVKGPRLTMKGACDAFRKEHKEVFERKGFLTFEKKVAIKDIFNEANKRGKDMGAWGVKLYDG